MLGHQVGLGWEELDGCDDVYIRTYVRSTKVRKRVIQYPVRWTILVPVAEASSNRTKVGLIIVWKSLELEETLN